MSSCYCDHGHEANEVRMLRTGGDAHVHVCRQHFEEEMAYRKKMQRKYSGSVWEFPEWNDLKVPEDSA